MLPHEVAHPKEAAEAEEVKPPEGYGSLAQEAVARSVVTDVVSSRPAWQLLRPAMRERVTRRLLKRLRSATDLAPHDVYLTDLAVQ